MISVTIELHGTQTHSVKVEPENQLQVILNKLVQNKIIIFENENDLYFTFNKTQLQLKSTFKDAGICENSVIHLIGKYKQTSNIAHSNTQIKEQQQYNLGIPQIKLVKNSERELILGNKSIILDGESQPSNFRSIFQNQLVQRFDSEKGINSMDFINWLNNLGFQHHIEATNITSKITKKQQELQSIFLKEDDFTECAKDNLVFLEKIFSNNLKIKNFQEIISVIEKIYNEVKHIKSGQQNKMIPELEMINGNKFAISICSVDGQMAHFGDDDYFSVQGLQSIVTYSMALQEKKAEYVHERVNCEPSGTKENALKMDKNGIPHNPLINTGSLVCASMIEKDCVQNELAKIIQQNNFNNNIDENYNFQQEMYDEPFSNPNSSKNMHSISRMPSRRSILQPGKIMQNSVGYRFNKMLQKWKHLVGNIGPVYMDNPIYLSEKENNNKIWAIGYFLKENGCFNEGSDLNDVIDFYLQLNSISCNSKMLSALAGTYANYGQNPLTEQQVFNSEIVQNSLSVMYQCGQYNESGKFAFNVGIPAKSAKSGIMALVIPGICGICVYSPKLNEKDISVRGELVAQMLSDKMNLHLFSSGIKNILDQNNFKNQNSCNICQWAVAVGDIELIKQLHRQNESLDQPDYDYRSPLHIACSFNQFEIVKYLVDVAQVEINILDFKNRTPLDDADTGNYTEISKYLRERGGYVQADILAEFNKQQQV